MPTPWSSRQSSRAAARATIGARAASDIGCIFAQAAQSSQPRAAGGRVWVTLVTLLAALFAAGCGGALNASPPLSLVELQSYDLRARWGHRSVSFKGVPEGRSIQRGAWMLALDDEGWPGQRDNAPILAWLQADFDEARLTHGLSAEPRVDQILTLRPALPADLDNPLEHRILRIQDAFAPSPTASRGTLALIQPGDAYGLLDLNPDKPLHARLLSIFRVEAVDASFTSLKRVAGHTEPLPGDHLVWLGPSAVAAPLRALIVAPDGIDLSKTLDEQALSRALSTPNSPVSMTRRRAPPTLVPSPWGAERTLQLQALNIPEAPTADLILWFFHVPGEGVKVALSGHAVADAALQPLLSVTVLTSAQRWPWLQQWLSALLLAHRRAHAESMLAITSACTTEAPFTDSAEPEAHLCAALLALNALSLGHVQDAQGFLDALSPSPLALLSTIYLTAREGLIDDALAITLFDTLQEDPHTREVAWLLRAQLLQQRGRAEDALALLRSPPDSASITAQRLALARGFTLEALQGDISSDAITRVNAAYKSLPAVELARAQLLLGQAALRTQPDLGLDLLQRAADSFDRANAPARAAATYLDIADALPRPSPDATPADADALSRARLNAIAAAASRFVLSGDHFAAASTLLDAAYLLRSFPSTSDPASEDAQTLTSTIAATQAHFGAAKRLDGAAQTWLLSAATLASTYSDPDAALDALTAASLYAHASGDLPTAAQSEWLLTLLHQQRSSPKETIYKHLQESARLADACGAPCADLKAKLRAIASPP
jgi:hypothetical protein